MQSKTLPAGKVTDFQAKVYGLLLQIPSGKVSTYAAMAKALGSSPRAVGGALRNNPFAPEVPCHRVLASTGFIGGFKGDWEKVPSGVNQEEKKRLLGEEGVEFDGNGFLLDKGCWWDGFDVAKV
ncbi:DNA binding methylated-DNA--cysteine S-methyltransferase [Byssothecium circinans]|uniref:Methylated-DNA--protein-cysteine methyltransferase n=1 Tax=Byssothecium circinans TaxID=147558 RepID=A0A6A5U4S1_9PLEO|nr:DNA binding methylated-DNA--cysteine S-methyltransferase [Byssothecium circinans]